MYLATVLGLILFMLIEVSSQLDRTSCSPERREADLRTCLTEIGNAAEDTYPMWFGSSFYERCPQGPVFTDPECSLTTGITIPNSISSLLFTPGTFNPDLLDRYLEVKFTSGPGSYWGCGNRFESYSTSSFTADPLSMETVRSWDARNEPEVTWQADPNQLYSLMVLDVPYGFTHGAYFNIPGNDLSSGDALKPYHGPRNPSRHGNVYAFLLFQQSDRMNGNPIFPVQIPGQPFNVTEFRSNHNFTGPVAMNWILATGDPFSMEFQRSNRIIDRCPSAIADVAETQSRPFLPKDFDLTVNVNISFYSGPFSFNSCCQVYSYEEALTYLNPLGNGVVKAGEVANTPTVQLTRSMTFFAQQSWFVDTLYTLISLDPDVPNPDAGTNERPLLHWLVVNIPHGDVSMGQGLMSYRGPSPPDRKPHYYYFLLYEQNGPVGNTSLPQYRGPLCDRCQFDISKYVSDNNLKLVGATWMVSNHDEFVRYTRVNNGESEEALCRDIPGYSEDCEIVSSHSCKMTVTFGLFLIGIILTLVKL